MIDPETAQDRCGQMIELARRAGADAADTVITGSASESVTVRLGALEDAERSEDESLSLRVFIGQRSATVSAANFTSAAAQDMAERAVAMARLAPEDPHAGLAPADALINGAVTSDLDLVDPQDPDPDRLKQRALMMEDAARAVAGVTNSQGASASFGESVVALGTSHGFIGAYRGTSHGISASVIAGEGASMQRDYAYRMARHAANLPPCADIGKLAGKRAVARLDPKTMPSGSMPIMFDPRVSDSLVGHLLGAMNGAGIARRSSFLLDRLGDILFPTDIVITDDPHRPRGPRSRLFDGEGLPTSRSNLVEGGHVTGWLLNAASARQLGLPPTGHASRGGSGAPGVSAANVHMHPGTLSRAAMIAEIADGVLVTELVGQGVNPVTGDYSRAASGFRIRDGELAEAVSGFTIAGNLLEMYAAMVPADDLEMHNAVNAPTIRVDGMTIAGDTA
ncbi:TldD/PmbA family protein [Pontixanthobacter sp.]|uniref:TldD/PmbA family protein n=1 Tax=Pontixanthobacter sp. TaxID=2792078 RepID=UPI003C7CCC45